MTKKKQREIDPVIDLTTLYHPHPKQVEAHTAPEKVVLFGGAMGGGKCEIHTTPISTVDGWKPIKEIVPGEQVWTLSPHGESELKEVTNSWDVGNKQAYKITNRSSSEVICSKEHPFLTPSGWKKLEDLTIGEHIGLTRITPEPADPEIEEDWYLIALGYLLGDGCLRGGTVGLTCYNEVQLREYESILPEDMILKPSADSLMDEEGKWVPTEDGHYVRNRNKKPKVRVSDTLLKMKLMMDGVYGHLSYTKFIPERLKRLSNRQTALLLNRLFATDGWACICPSDGSVDIGFSSTSIQLATDVKELLLRFGIRVAIRETKTPSPFGRCYELSISKGEEHLIFCREIGIVGKEEAIAKVLEKQSTRDLRQSHSRDPIPKSAIKPLLTVKVPSNDYRAYCIYRNFLEDSKQKVCCRWYVQEAVEKHPQYFGVLRNLAYSDIYWDEVTSIEDLGKEEPMWDLEVEDNHNYIANSFITHNSAWLCNEAIQLSLDYPGNRGYLCRHENVTFKKTTYLTLMEFLHPALVVQHNQGEGWIELINKSRIYYGGLKPSQVGKPVDRLKSLELGWFGIDEASETAEQYFLILISRLRHKTKDGTPMRYKALLTSNPEPGWVRTRFLEEKPRDHRFIASLPSDNPHLPEGYVEDTLGQLPEDWQKKYVHGDWYVADTANRVFPFYLIKRAIEFETQENASWPVEFGCDIAGMGGDKNIVAMRKGPIVRIIHETRFKSTMETAGAIAELALLYRPIAIKVDAVGIGAGVYDRLKEMGLPAVKVLAGARAIDPEKYYNVRAEMMWSLRKRMERNWLDLPDDDDHELTNQMLDCVWERQSERTIKLQSKKELVAQEKKSPDKLDAIGMAFYTPKSTITPGLSFIDQPFGVQAVKSMDQLQEEWLSPNNDILFTEMG